MLSALWISLCHGMRGFIPTLHNWKQKFERHLLRYLLHFFDHHGHNFLFDDNIFLYLISELMFSPLII